MRNSVSSIIDSLHTVNESGFNGKEFLSDLKKGRCILNVFGKAADLKEPEAQSI